jgi:flagellar biosynthetic protein FliO
MNTRIRIAGPSTVGPMAHRGASPARLARLAVERLVARGVAPLPEALRRRPMLTAIAALAALVTLGTRIVGMPPAAAAPSGDASALSFFAGSSAGQGGSAGALPLGAAAGSIDIVDLLVKGLLVIALLYITLRVLRRFQTGGTTPGARIRVLESRTIGPKATIHLVAVGDRQLVVGLTPGRLVTLAELSADELDVAGEDLEIAGEPTGGDPDGRADGRAGDPVAGPREHAVLAGDQSLTASIARQIARVLR